ncbi:MAG: sulfite oxidase [Cyanobacteria bacterium SZAS LIN-3]|nr:sulfite oxidase [Cyanobacteria bacterium SZAS LIN-3]
MPSRIVRSVDPEVLEYPFDKLTACTPNDLFYVRDHFPRPQIDLATWSLAVEGTVAEPLKLSYEEILALPSRSVTVTLECAGNNRTFLNPPVKGVQWDLGGVSNAVWTGVPVRDIVSRAGLLPQTLELVFDGADEGNPDDSLPSPISFARSLPLHKALAEDVILAHSMNGERLGAAHGFPLRLIVPGWYAVASVKWLRRIAAIDHKFDGYFQTVDYSYIDRSGPEPVRRPITEMLVKSLIAHPRQGESIAKGKLCEISGAAWSGAGWIARVEVSTNGGASWLEASVDAGGQAGVWTMWRFSWLAPSEPGDSVLMARATDEHGNVQPATHDPDRETYMINFCFPVPVKVV